MSPPTEVSLRFPVEPKFTIRRKDRIQRPKRGQKSFSRSLLETWTKCFTAADTLTSVQLTTMPTARSPNDGRNLRTLPSVDYNRERVSGQPTNQARGAKATEPFPAGSNNGKNDKRSVPTSKEAPSKQPTGPRDPHIIANVEIAAGDINADSAATSPRSGPINDDRTDNAARSSVTTTAPAVTGAIRKLNNQRVRPDDSTDSGTSTKRFLWTKFNDKLKQCQETILTISALIESTHEGADVDLDLLRSQHNLLRKLTPEIRSAIQRLASETGNDSKVVKKATEAWKDLEKQVIDTDRLVKSHEELILYIQRAMENHPPDSEESSSDYELNLAFQKNKRQLSQNLQRALKRAEQYPKRGDYSHKKSLANRRPNAVPESTNHSEDTDSESQYSRTALLERQRSLRRRPGTRRSSIETRPDPDHPGDDWYRQFPGPWAQPPRRPVDPRDRLSAPNTRNIKKFDGKPDNYILWRQKVIHSIHRHPGSWQDKLNAIESLLDTDNCRELQSVVPRLEWSRSSYLQLVTTLEDIYGGEDRTIHHYYLQLRRQRRVREGDVEAFNTLITNAKAYADVLALYGRDVNQTTFHDIFLRLDETWQRKFIQFRRNAAHQTPRLDRATVNDLLKWMECERHDLLDQRLYSLRDPFPKNDQQKEIRSDRPKPFGIRHAYSTQVEHNVTTDDTSDNESETILLSQTKETETKSESCPACSETTHKIYQCEKFKNLPLKGKAMLVKSKKLCYCCLSSKHLVRRCTSNRTCQHCKRGHHTLLHNPNRKDTDPGGLRALLTLPSDPEEEEQNASSQESNKED